MSFLVKAVLGQGVVHPPAHAPSTLAPSAPTTRSGGDVVENKQSVAAMAQATSGTRSANEATSLATHTLRASALAAGGDASGPTPTRTLMLRVRTCTIVQDLRDALHELESHSDLPYVIGPSEVTQFVELLRSNADDGAIVDATLHILANLTDVDRYPSSTAGPSSHADAATPITARERRRICHGLLAALKEHVPLLLDHVKTAAATAAGSTPSVARQRHALQILQRLEEYDATTVHKLLLRERGLAVLTDVLARPAEEVAPRREVLALLHALTAIDTELQTLLAFDNGFDILLQVALADSSDDATVSLALATVQNLLRNNKATQKLFREMSCARYVAALLDRLAQDPAHLPSCGLTAVTILSCLMRDEPEGERGVVQAALMQCKVLPPLTRLAMRGAAVDDGTCIEALRALAAMLQDSRRAIEEFVQCDVTTDVRSRAQGQTTGARWGALRAVLHYLFASSDRTLLNASANVLLAVLGTEDAQAHVLDVLLRGLAPVVDAGRGTVAWHELLECGQALSYALFAPLAPASGKYYAAHLLRAMLELPFIPGSLLHTPWSTTASGGHSGALTTPPTTFFTAVVSYTVHCLAGGAASQGVDSAALAAYVGAVLVWLVNGRDAVALLLSREDSASHYTTLLQQARREGAAQVRLWCATLAACICLHAPPASGAVAPSTMTAARVAAADNVSGRGAITARTQLTQSELLSNFQQQLGGPGFFESVLLDITASSSQWGSPAARALAAPEPVVYDACLVKLIQDIMSSFKTLCVATTTPRLLPSPAQPPIASVDAGKENKDDRDGSEARRSPAALCVLPDPPSTSSLSLPRTPHGRDAQCAGRANAASVAAADAQKSAASPIASQELAALHETLRARDEELRQLREANERLCAEAARLRGEDRTTIVADHTSNRAAATMTPESVVDEVAELRERVPLLEEALRAKEEEHEQLVHSLEMMEGQLRQMASARDGEQEVSVLREALQTLRDERDVLLCLVAELAHHHRGTSRQTTPSPVIAHGAHASMTSDAVLALQGGAAEMSASLPRTEADKIQPSCPPVHDVQPLAAPPPPSLPLMQHQTTHLDSLTINSTPVNTASDDAFMGLVQPASFPPAAAPPGPHDMPHSLPYPVHDTLRMTSARGDQQEALNKDTTWEHETRAVVAAATAVAVPDSATPDTRDHESYNPFIDEPDDEFGEIGAVDLR